MTLYLSVIVSRAVLKRVHENFGHNTRRVSLCNAERFYVYLDVIDDCRQVLLLDTQLSQPRRRADFIEPALQSGLARCSPMVGWVVKGKVFHLWLLHMS